MAPRIDPHLHLGGLISPQFVWDVIRFTDNDKIKTYQDVYQQMTFSADEPRTFYGFLDKFRILDDLPWSEEIIEASIYSVCQYLESEHIDYAWIDFSINKYMNIGWSQHQAIQFIYDAFQKYRKDQVGLLLSMKYESERESQRRFAKLIEHEDTAKCLIGIDLVGDEAHFNSDFYEPIFIDWNKAGKITRSHVGESQSVENVVDSIMALAVTNIAHGFKVINHPELILLAKELEISFDLSITSNYITGVWTDPNSHPIKAMLDAGLIVTLGSDDPVQCSTSLDAEFIKAKCLLGLSEDHCAVLEKTAWLNTLKMLNKQNRNVPAKLLST